MKDKVLIAFFPLCRTKYVVGWSGKLELGLAFARQVVAPERFGVKPLTQSLRGTSSGCSDVSV